MPLSKNRCVSALWAALNMGLQFHRQKSFTVPTLADFGRLRKMLDTAIYSRRCSRRSEAAGGRGELAPLLPITSAGLRVSFHTSVFVRIKFHPTWKPQKTASSPVTLLIQYHCQIGQDASYSEKAHQHIPCGSKPISTELKQ